MDFPVPTWRITGCFESQLTFFPYLVCFSNVFHKNPQPTRMTEKDYERVEQELIQMMAQKQCANFGLMQGGWSTGAMGTF